MRLRMAAGPRHPELGTEGMTPIGAENREYYSYNWSVEPLTMGIA